MVHGAKSNLRVVEPPGGASIVAYLPPQYSINGHINGNPVKRMRRPGGARAVSVANYVSERTKGILLSDAKGETILVVPHDHSPALQVDSILILPKPRDVLREDLLSAVAHAARWIYPVQEMSGFLSADKLVPQCAKAFASWHNEFSYVDEVRDGDLVITPGLRPPQIGAIHAALAHWSVSEGTGTIVMPTGTGKTETMLALMVCASIRCLLVVVPTDALRTQIAMKFQTFGVLKRFGVIGEAALFPIVTMLTHLPTVDDVDSVFAGSNVIITTAAIVGACSTELQRRMAEKASHLFIDEAHHVRASTWEAFRSAFSDRRVLQFTATPFRQDRKLVDGDRVFNYPLRKAQEEGYFKKIGFKSVTEFSVEAADEAIARVAIAQLEEDLAGGFDHIVMARAGSINRAHVIEKIYQKIGAPHGPLVITNASGVRERRRILIALASRECRVVICVDMLGEGFDLPALKIAALHDSHRSLAVTLQFTGRFTRSSEKIGDATVVANIADSSVEEALRDLYEESADWNYLLRRLSEGATRRHRDRTDFIQGFDGIPSDLPIHSIFPKMSAAVFRTSCARWRPEGAANVPRREELFTGPAINHQQKVLIYVTRETEAVTWGPERTPINVFWHLYLAFWDEERSLLFVHSSNKDSHHEALAKEIAGSDVSLVRGDQVFRALHGISRLALMNMGLKHSMNRANRFTMYVGSDVIQGMEEALMQNRSVTNVFGIGYANGFRATMGCSTRGRIWSYQVADDVTDWVKWCRHVGQKLVDSSISTLAILRSVMRPRQVEERPATVPIVIEWPDEFFVRDHDVLHVEIAGRSNRFFDVDIVITTCSESGPIRFQVRSGDQSAEYELRFSKGDVEYLPTSANTAAIVHSRRTVRLEDWFRREPPTIRFADGSFLDGNWLLSPSVESRVSYDRERVQAWDWTGTDLSVESQTALKRKDSIQFRIIGEALRGRFGCDYMVIVDDDGSGEIADVVAIAATDDRLLVHLFHCKYSSGNEAGRRVGDLYEVCGQAQKSVAWRGKLDRMLTRLGKRDHLRTLATGVSRFEKGAPENLVQIRKMSRYVAPEFHVFIVQPGVSKVKASESQLELLAVTAAYLKETFAVDLTVIASA